MKMTKGELLTDMAETHRLEMSPYVYRLFYKVADELDELEADNAKLRELCASLYEFSMSEYPDGTELNFAYRIRELGIEVE